MKIREITQVALVTAMIIVLGLMPPIPLGFIPIPIVLQNLGIMLAAVVLGPKRGTLAVGLFLLLALIGFPVLSGGQAGPAVFVGPTGGYLIGWLLTPALVNSFLTISFMRHPWGRMVGGWLGAVLIVDVIGSIWLAISANTPMLTALASNLVFLPGDTLKIVLACLIAERVRVPKAKHI